MSGGGGKIWWTLRSVNPNVEKWAAKIPRCTSARRRGGEVPAKGPDNAYKKKKTQPAPPQTACSPFCRLAKDAQVSSAITDRGASPLRLRQKPAHTFQLNSFYFLIHCECVFIKILLRLGGITTRWAAFLLCLISSIFPEDQMELLNVHSNRWQMPPLPPVHRHRRSRVLPATGRWLMELSGNQITCLSVQAVIVSSNLITQSPDKQQNTRDVSLSRMTTAAQKWDVPWRKCTSAWSSVSPRFNGAADTHRV